MTDLYYRESVTSPKNIQSFYRSRDGKPDGCGILLVVRLPHPSDAKDRMQKNFALNPRPHGSG